MSEQGPILIAAGGTGGHLFPAQALAEELIKRGRKVVLITDERGLKWKDSFSGVEMLATRSATPYRGGLMGKISAAVVILQAIWTNYWRLRQLKPAVVVGFGGYPSIPPMVAAILRRIPRIIHEQNGVMGRANKALASHMSAIAVTVPDPIGMPPKAKENEFLVGNPVRPDVVKKSRKAYPALEPDSDIHLVVFGGSQGATIFADVVPAAAACLPSVMLARLKVHQQCREEDVARVRKAYDAMGIDAVVAPFFDAMPVLMALAHLVISRSGASTVSELMVMGRPSVLVPLPQALDDDQGANARYLVEVGGAWLMRQDSFTAEALAELMARLFTDPSALQSAARIAKKLGRPEAAMHLADLVESIDDTVGSTVGNGAQKAGGGTGEARKGETK